MILPKMLPMNVTKISKEELSEYNDNVQFVFCNKEFFACFGFSGKTIKTDEYEGKCHIASKRKLWGSELDHVLGMSDYIYVIESFTLDDGRIATRGGFGYLECESITPNAECDW